MGVLADWEIERSVKIEPFAEGSLRPGVISYGVSSYGYDVRVGRHFKVFEPYFQTAAITDISAAWVAGIIDGEGHIRTDTGGQNRGLHLSVANTNRPMLEQLQGLFQTGQIYEKMKKKETNKQGYEWVVTKTQHIQEILIRVLPYLTIKRQAAQEALSMTYPKAGLPMPVVDPKNFPERAFVDVEGDSCLIPPNSFALAETVEYLEIPRDIIAVCVGKSTYARCGIIVNVTPLEPEWRGRVTIEISNTTPLPAKIYAGEGIAQILFLRTDAVCRTSYADKKGKYQDQKGLTLPFVVGPGQRPEPG
jgi:deoxycytidine triphosphate deaminase